MSTSWITKNGRAVQISQMETEHIENTVAFLRRKALSLRMERLSAMSRYIADAPDGAAMACESEADYLIDLDDEDFLSQSIPQYAALVAELARRKA